MDRYASFIDLIRGLESADPRRGITLVDSRFRESFHPYSELFRHCRALASGFRRQGVRKGQKVLIALSTDIETLRSLLALVYVGAVPLSVPAPLMGQDPAAYKRRMMDLMRFHRADRVLSGGDLVDMGTGSDRLSPAPEAERPGDAIEPASVEPDDTAFVQFSSGSTAHPKGVRITHRNLLYNLKLIVENDRRSAESVMVSWLPLYHDMGFVGCLLSNFIFKNALILMDPRCFLTRPISWLDAVSRSGGTVTAIPNFALDICNERITDEQLAEHSLDLSSFRYIYDGSEPVRLRSIRRFNEKFARYGFVPGSIYPVYGMSEVTLILSAPKFGESLVTREVEGTEVPSVGHPLGDFEVQIRAESGELCADGSTGELWLRGTAVTPGYLSATEGNEGLIEDGWLATGDLGMRDEKGRLYILGRKKDLIISQGSNFYGHDVAAAIEELSSVRSGQVFVFGVDVNQKERVVVMTTPPRKRRKGSAGATGADSDENGLTDFKLSIRKHVLREFGLRVHDVHIVPRLPKTTSGKVARHICERMYKDSLD